MAQGVTILSSDYGPSTGVGAIIDNSQNTSIAQDSMAKTQQLIEQHQKEQQADEEKESARRQQAMAGLQIASDGMRPVDREPLRQMQNAINDYATLSFADGKNPLDPQNKDQYNRLQTLMNTAKDHAEVSTMLNKANEQDRQTFEKDGGKKYHPDSQERIVDAQTRPMQAMLDPNRGKPDDVYTKSETSSFGDKAPASSDGKFYYKNGKRITPITYGFEVKDQQERAKGRQPVGIGASNLIAAPQFNLGKWAQQNVKDKEKPWDVPNGEYMDRYEGSNYPNEVDKKTGAEIPETSGVAVHGRQLASDPQGLDYIKQRMIDQPALAHQAVIDADARTKANANNPLVKDKYVSPEQVMGEYLISNGFLHATRKSQETLEAKDAHKAKQQASGQAIKDQSDYNYGRNVIYPVFSTAAEGRGSGTFMPDGVKRTRATTDIPTGRTFNYKGQEKADIGLGEEVDPNDPNMMRVYTSAQQAAHEDDPATPAYTLMPKDQFVRDWGGYLAKFNKVKVAPALNGALNEAQRNNELKAGSRTDTKKAADRMEPEKTETKTVQFSPTVQSIVEGLNKVRQIVSGGKKVEATGTEQPKTESKPTEIPTLKSKAAFDKLPSGATYFREVNGVVKKFKKPNGRQQK